MLAIMRNREASGLDELIRDVWGHDFLWPLSVNTSQQGPRIPSYDAVTSGDKFTVTVELPGLDKSDVRAEVTGDVLTIDVPRAEEKDGTRKHEFELKRSWRLRGTEDERFVEAKMTNGLLIVTVETKAKKPTARPIDIA